MPIPIQTQILDIIELRLKNILASNGYETTLEKIERARLQPFNNNEMPAINYYYTADTLIKAVHGGVSERFVSIIVEYYDSTRDDIFSDLASRLASDVLISLNRDVSAPLVSDLVSDRLGGAVMRLEVDSITPAIGKGQKPYCGAVVVLNVYYRVDRQDSFTLIN